MAEQWYYQAFGQEFGPLSLDELAGMYQEGALSADDLVREGSDGTWVAASQAKNLTSFVEANAELATDIDSFLLMDEKRDVPASAPVATVPPHSSHPAPKPAAESRGMWYFQSIGQEFGPVPFSELLEMASRGEVSPDDSVRKGETGQWVSAGLIEGLFPEVDESSQETEDDSDFAVSPDLQPMISNPGRQSDDDFAISDDVQASLDSRSRESRSGVARTSFAQSPAKPPPSKQWTGSTQTATAHSTIATSAMASQYEHSDPHVAVQAGWYCYLNDQEYGPVDLTELQGYVASGQITPEVYVRYGNEGEWVTAAQVPELFAAPAPIAAPPAIQAPPLSPAATPAGAAGGSLVDAERMELAHQLLALLKREINPDLLASAAPPTTGGWYCNISGSIMGPVSIDSLVQMVLQKRIFADDLIRLGTTGEWFPAKTVPELFPQQSGPGKKKSGLDDANSVLSKIDKMYREAQEAKEKQEAATASGTATAPAARTEAPKPAASGDVFRNMNSSIARAAVSGPVKKTSGGSGSSGGDSFAEQFDDLLAMVGLRGKGMYVGIAVAVLAVGYYFAPGLLAGFSASASYEGMMAIHSQVMQAHSGESEPASWEAQAKKLKKSIKDLMAKVKGGTGTSPLRDVSKMGLYLQEMAEHAAKKAAPGVPPEEDPFEIAKTRFEDAQKRAAKKLGKKIAK